MNLLQIITWIIIAAIVKCEPAVNVSSSLLDVKVGLKVINFFEKIHENLCPIEYQACWCDHTNNSNNNENSNSYKTNTLSIMIDCQYYGTSESISNSSFSNKNSNRVGQANKLLLEIPNLSNALAKFRYLHYVTHLDLSRTGIVEVPTDAFKGLNGLQTIVITNCKHLKRINMFAFRNLVELKTLIITNNPGLHELQPHAFGSLKNLNFLSLSMNKLNAVDGYIFSASTSIKIIDFIGNPIKKIKSHAFHGLRNVTDLLLSLKQNVSPIEIIEDDSFISTAFVDNIFLEGIPARVLHTNAFRGLSYCKNLHLSNTFIEHIEANAFYRANNIDLLDLKYSRIKTIHVDAFRGIFSVELIDLKGNYLSTIDESAFGSLINFNLDEQRSKIINDSIVVIDNEKNNKYIVKKITFDQNPIQCNCKLLWILNKKSYSNFISLPEICAGPKGYDCALLKDLSVENLNCDSKNGTTTSVVKAPCDVVKFGETDKPEEESYPLPVPSKNKKKYNEGGYRWEDENQYDTDSQNYDDENYYDETKQIIVSTTSKIANGIKTQEKKLENIISLLRTTSPPANLKDDETSEQYDTEENADIDEEPTIEKSTKIIPILTTYNDAPNFEQHKKINNDNNHSVKISSGTFSLKQFNFFNLNHGQRFSFLNIDIFNILILFVYFFFVC